MVETGVSRQELNQVRMELYRQLPSLKQWVCVLYQELTEKGVPWEDGVWIELVNITEVLRGGISMFAIPEQTRAEAGRIRDAVEHKTAERENLLCSLFGVLDEMETLIGNEAKRCNACGAEVFFLPMPEGYQTMRKRHGFPYWNADFQLESRERYGCPVCGAYDRDRLMIAFLEEVKAEGGEKLRMLQIAPSPAIERYALSREDICYESTDLMMSGVTFQADLQHMDMVEDETYDIIVCSHVLEHVRNDALAMKELYRILKPDGVCLVLVPLIVGKADTEEEWGCSEEENWRRFGQYDHSRLYGKKDFIRRLQNAGFYINELDKQWFGEEFYQEYGFDDLSIMYVATKDIKLVEPNEDDPHKQIQELQAENRLLRGALSGMNDRLAELERASRTNFSILFHAKDNIGWEINDRRFLDKLWYPQIMSIEDTIEDIVTNRKSIARFGDGEFGIMCGVQRWRFQKKDEALANRLKEVLHSKREDVLVGLIDFYGDFGSWTDSAANGARLYLTPEVRKQHYALLERDRLYANTSISRNESWEQVRNQKRIWDGRDCVFIEGYQTRMGVGNDLFDNARSIVRILCPAESAFDRYEEIYNEALRQPEDRLFLIALGPTASVLAYDLAVQGYQAVDIGHADISYEWLLRGERGRIPNKYTNEEPGGYIVDDICDAEYEAQIIADFH